MTAVAAQKAKVLTPRRRVEGRVERLEALVQAQLRLREDRRDKRAIARAATDALDACDVLGDDILKGRALAAVWPLMLDVSLFTMSEAAFMGRANKKKKAYERCLKKAGRNPKARLLCKIYYYVCGYFG